MRRNKVIGQVRDDLRQAMQIADEMRRHNAAYRETLQTMFDDDQIPLEVRQQYERLLVRQITRGTVF